jgi:hypothetical protein
MNKDYILFNLRETLEELQRSIARLEADPGYPEGELRIAIAHAYHHLNHAWNARHSSRAESSACSDENFARWRKFPRDLDPSF